MYAIEKAYNDAPDPKADTDFFKQGDAVNAEHCTAPHSPGSLGWPSKHDVKISKVTRINDDRYEVETRRDEKESWLSVHYRYVVERRADGWRISAESSIDPDGPIYELWRDIDSRVWQLYDEHVGLFDDRQDRLMEVIGKVNWAYRTETGMLSFGDHFAWHTQIVGSESEEKFTWRWGWANEASNLPEASVTLARKLKEYGEKHKLVDFTTPFFPLGMLGGWHFLRQRLI
jgi:hypothetical protein